VRELFLGSLSLFVLILKSWKRQLKNLPNTDAMQQMLNPRWPAIEKRIKQFNGLAG